MKLCIDCKYFNHRDYMEHRYGFTPAELFLYSVRQGFVARCHHPKLLSPIDGACITTCDQARSPVYGDCGRDGILHEQIPTEELAAIKQAFNTLNEEKRQSWERIHAKKEEPTPPPQPVPEPVSIIEPSAHPRPWWQFWK